MNDFWGDKEKEQVTGLQRDYIVIVGTSGSGKTFLANKLLYQYNRVIIIDPNGHDYEGELLTDVDQLEDFADKPLFRVKLTNLLPEQVEQVAMQAYLMGNVMLCIDEAASYLPSKQKLAQIYRVLAFQGRHKQVSLMIVSQRFSSIDLSMRSQATQLISFAQFDARDVKGIKDYCGGNPLADSLTRMKKHSYLYCNHLTGETVIKEAIK